MRGALDLPGVTAVDVTPGNRVFSVTYDPGQITTDRMLDALRQAKEEAILVAAAAGQDIEFLHALEAAQAHRPRQLAATARIAPATEPGTPLVIHGRLVAEDGRTPIPQAVVFAYHTDQEGHYDRPGSRAHSWRLRGWAQTDAEGRFAFSTIRPGAYPARNEPAHVHLTVFSAKGRYHAGALLFADDPLVSASARETAQAAGDFGPVRPVRREGATEHVDLCIRLHAKDRF